MKGNAELAFRIFQLMVLFSIVSCSSHPESDENLSEKSADSNAGPFIFVRMSEPNEKAFSFLLPSGWTITGGITRVDPNADGGAANSLESKLYMKLSSPDNQATIGWLPDSRFIDIKQYAGADAAVYSLPGGSNYKGMEVKTMPSSSNFIINTAIPFAHPHARNIKVQKTEKLPGLADHTRKLSSILLRDIKMNYEASVVSFNYFENGVEYREKMVCVIEDTGQAGGRLWSNRETYFVRATADMFERFLSLFVTVGQSVKVNPSWLENELRSQSLNCNGVLKTWQEFQNAVQALSGYRSEANSDICDGMFLSLSGQKDFANPFTGETERGTGKWDFRWENERGDVIYSNSLVYNPNEDGDVKCKGYKLSETRK